MNIWLQTEHLKHNKLRQSLSHSSVTSLRSPLPVILQNERNDHDNQQILSNSNISVSIGGQSSHNNNINNNGHHGNNNGNVNGNNINVYGDRYGYNQHEHKNYNNVFGKGYKYSETDSQQYQQQVQILDNPQHNIHNIHQQYYDNNHINNNNIQNGIQNMATIQQQYSRQISNNYHNHNHNHNHNLNHNFNHNFNHIFNHNHNLNINNNYNGQQESQDNSSQNIKQFNNNKHDVSLQAQKYSNNMNNMNKNRINMIKQRTNISKLTNNNNNNMKMNINNFQHNNNINKNNNNNTNKHLYNSSITFQTSILSSNKQQNSINNTNTNNNSKGKLSSNGRSSSGRHSSSSVNMSKYNLSKNKQLLNNNINTSNNINLKHNNIQNNVNNINNKKILLNNHNNNKYNTNNNINRRSNSIDNKNKSSLINKINNNHNNNINTHKPQIQKNININKNVQEHQQKQEQIKQQSQDQKHETNNNINKKLKINSAILQNNNNINIKNNSNNNFSLQLVNQNNNNNNNNINFNNNNNNMRYNNFNNNRYNSQIQTKFVGNVQNKMNIFSSSNSNRPINNNNVSYSNNNSSNSINNSYQHSPYIQTNVNNLLFRKRSSSQNSNNNNNNHDLNNNRLNEIFQPKQLTHPILINPNKNTNTTINKQAASTAWKTTLKQFTNMNIPITMTSSPSPSPYQNAIPAIFSSNVSNTSRNDPLTSTHNNNNNVYLSRRHSINSMNDQPILSSHNNHNNNINSSHILNSRPHTHTNNTNNTNNSKRNLLTTTRNLNQDRRQYIISIIQYCSNQIGIACYNINTGEIYLIQIIQRLTYIKTISTLERFYPKQILYSNTLQNTLLIRKLIQKFRRTAFRPVKRPLFDQTKGYNIYILRSNHQHSNPDHKFLAYAALNALIYTLQSTFQMTFTYNVLNINWHHLQQVLVIDSQTVSDLEIFINKQTKNIKNTFIDNFICMTNGGTRMLRSNILQPLTDLKAINQRACLVQFLLLGQNKIIFDMLEKQLGNFKNYQPITAKFIQNPKCDNLKSLKSYLNAIFWLARMCFQLKNLQKKISNIKDNQQIWNNINKNSSIIKVLYQKLKDTRLEQIRAVIQVNFDPEILKNYQSSVNQIYGRVPDQQQGTNNNNNYKNRNKNKTKNWRSFTSNNDNNNNRAKRDNFIFLFKLQKIKDQFAQISRLIYSHTIQDILKFYQTIKQKCPPATSLKLLYNTHRGYFLQSKPLSSSSSTTNMPLNLSQFSTQIQDDIIFINSKPSTNTITFSTSILVSLNNRLKQNQGKLIYQSMELLLDVIKNIQKNIQVLFQVNCSLATLDMILAFVGFVRRYASKNNIKFSKPIFNTNSSNTPTLSLNNLRTIWTSQKYHKISPSLTLTLEPPHNSLILHKELNSFQQLNILYSIGLLTILAQIGCLVPVKKYQTMIYDTLISKMEVQNNLENRVSHFQGELISLKNILENVQQNNHNSNNNNNDISNGNNNGNAVIANKENTKHNKKSQCLILIDQICTGTKPDEQYAISLAVMQQLLNCNINNDNNNNSNSNKDRNVVIALVSDITLFNLLAKFDKVSLCKFTAPISQNNASKTNKIQQKQLTQQQKQRDQQFQREQQLNDDNNLSINQQISIKDKQMIECFNKYNFNKLFIDIYQGLVMKSSSKV